MNPLDKIPRATISVFTSGCWFFKTKQIKGFEFAAWQSLEMHIYKNLVKNQLTAWSVEPTFLIVIILIKTFFIVIKACNSQ